MFYNGTFFENFSFPEVNIKKYYNNIYRIGNFEIQKTFIYIGEIKISQHRRQIMKNEYGMITVNDYLNGLDNVRYTSVTEVEIVREVEKYILTKRRNETNAKIVEALLA